MSKSENWVACVGAWKEAQLVCVCVPSSLLSYQGSEAHVVPLRVVAGVGLDARKFSPVHLHSEKDGAEGGQEAAHAHSELSEQGGDCGGEILGKEGRGHRWRTEVRRKGMEEGAQRGWEGKRMNGTEGTRAS